MFPPSCTAARQLAAVPVCHTAEKVEPLHKKEKGWRDGFLTVPAGLVRSCTALPAMRYLCAHAQYLYFFIYMKYRISLVTTSLVA